MDGKVQYGKDYPQVRKPKGVAFMPASPDGHFRLVVADSGNNRLRLLEGTFGDVASSSSIDANMTTLAGSARDGFHDGAAALATFNNPMGLAFTSDGGKLVVVDQQINSYLGNRRLRLLMTTLCGQGKTEGSEACDDGNTADGDGCSSLCAVEAGWTCNSECLTFCQGTKPSVCSAICGDGRNVTSEQCDDGNLANGDGCTNKCRVEFGWECSPAPRPPSPPSPPAPALTDVGNHAHLLFPSVERGRRRQRGGRVVEDGGVVARSEARSVCAPVCGDGFLRGKEECDDGNRDNNDGCSADCRREEAVGKLVWDGRKGSWFFVEGNVTVSGPSLQDVTPSEARLVLLRQVLAEFAELPRREVVIVGAWLARQVDGVLLCLGFGVFLVSYATPLVQRCSMPGWQRASAPLVSCDDAWHLVRPLIRIICVPHVRLMASSCASGPQRPHSAALLTPRGRQHGRWRARCSRRRK